MALSTAIAFLFSAFNTFWGDAVRAARPAVLIGGTDVVDILFCLRRDGLTAVSYTHLDVYKRQLQSRGNQHESVLSLSAGKE